MADRFNKIRIGEIHLTRDGSPDSTPCKLSVSNLDLLLMDKTGSAEPVASGAPFILLADVNGVEITISVIKLKQAVYEDLRDSFNVLNNTGAKVELEITGRTKNRTLLCNVHPKNPISPAGFFNDWINQVVIRLIMSEEI